MDIEVLLLDEELQHQLPPARKRIPVDVAQIITVDEGPVLGEFDARSPRAAAALGLHPSAHELPRRETQRLQALDELSVKQRINGGLGHKERNRKTISPNAARSSLKEFANIFSIVRPSACASKLSMTR